MKPTIFLERDGILNLPRIERNYPASPLTMDQFEINQAALEPMRKLKEAGFLLLAVTNQPGLSRGYQSRRDLDLMHMMLKKRFPLDDILMCAHDEMDRCPCRKPKPGLLLEAAFKWHIDLDRSFMISDKWQDAQAAHNAGCSSLLIKSPWNGSGHHDFLVSDLAAAADKAIQLQQAHTFA